MHINKTRAINQPFRILYWITNGMNYVLYVVNASDQNETKSK